MMLGGLGWSVWATAIWASDNEAMAVNKSFLIDIVVMSPFKQIFLIFFVRTKIFIRDDSIIYILNFNSNDKCFLLKHGDLSNNQSVVSREKEVIKLCLFGYGLSSKLEINFMRLFVLERGKGNGYGV